MINSSVLRTLRRQFVPLLAVTLVMMAAGMLPGCGKGDQSDRPARSAKPAQSARYTCPMHPTVTSDQPGRCPICNMELVPITGDSTATDTAGARHGA